MAPKEKPATAETVTYARARKATDGAQGLPPRVKGKPEPTHQHGYADCPFCDNEHAAIRPESGRFVFTCSVCRAVWFISGGVLAAPVKEALDLDADFGLAVDLGVVDKGEMDAHYQTE